MIGSVSQSENAPKITLSDFTEPEVNCWQESQDTWSGTGTELLVPDSSVFQTLSPASPCSLSQVESRGWEQMLFLVT